MVVRNVLVEHVAFNYKLQLPLIIATIKLYKTARGSYHA